MSIGSIFFIMQPTESTQWFQFGTKAREAAETPRHA